MLESVTISDTVHYVRDGECHAAIVLKASRDSNLVTLRVFGEGVVARDSCETGVDYGDLTADKTWHWGSDHCI